MPILPAHVLKDINGDGYLKQYNFKLLPGSGPYTIQESDIQKGRSITVRRRTIIGRQGQRECGTQQL